MKDTRKRIRLSILTQIAILFLSAFILSIAAVMALSRYYMMAQAVAQGEEVAQTVAAAAQTAIDSGGNLNALMENEKLRARTHRIFRYICSRTNIRYLYLYTVDKDGKKHYIICSAKNMEDDLRMNREYGFGSVNDRPLYEAEVKVLNGTEKESYEFINNDYGNVCMYVYPVTENNKILALIGVDYSIDSMIEKKRENARVLFITVILIIGAAYVISLLLIRRSVIRHILTLSGRMRDFVKNRENNVPAYKPSPLIENEITDMEGSFDQMVKDTYRYVDDIGKLAGEKAQSQVQLDIARKIQLGIVPQEHCNYGRGYEAYGCEHPAKEVGGDFYSIFSPDDNHICMIVGDISGKGITAALFMVMVRMAISEKIRNGCALDETLNRVNKDICMMNPENLFATVFALMLNTRTGVLTYANAGHEPPLLLNGDSSFLKMKSGMPLGLFQDAEIVTEELKLNDGEGILVYTDGVTDAINGDKVRYGRDGLWQTVNSVYTSCGNSYNADKVVEAVVKSIGEYSKDEEQFDDITCTVLVYNENGGRELTPDIASFKTIKQTMTGLLGENDRSRNMILACEEIFANIINYSGADDVYFYCSLMGKIFSVTFSDNGIPFDPSAAAVADKDFEELDTGGMGIKLARMYSNEMIYIRVKNRNMLTLKFEITG